MAQGDEQLQVHFRGAVAVERDAAGGTVVHILSSAAEASAFGLGAEFVAQLFTAKRARPPREQRPAGGDQDAPPMPLDLCATVGGFGPDGFFIHCRDISCTAGGGFDCWMYSRKRDGSDERREGSGAPEPGRVYYCTCVYES